MTVWREATDSLRAQKVTAAETTKYLWDEQNVLHETDGALALVAQYADLPGIWGSKFSLRRSGASAFYVPDHQGNARALTNAAQAVTDTLTTDAWGVVLAATGATVNPYKAYAESGYYLDAPDREYVRLRDLRNDHGRWMSRDPIGFWGGDWNLFRYVHDCPTIAPDPDGLYWRWCCWWCVGWCCNVSACPPKRRLRPKPVQPQPPSPDYS